jgi:hypothetical protein
MGDMVRLVGFVLMVALLGASGAAIYTRVQHDGVHTFVHRLGLKATGRSAAEDELLSAGQQLQADHDQYKTYRRTDLTRFSGMTFGYATDNSYCVQLNKGGAWYHMAGPEGAPLDGRCSF